MPLSRTEFQILVELARIPGHVLSHVYAWAPLRIAQNLSVADELRTFLGYTIRLVVTTEREIKQGLDRYYNAAGESVESIIGELEDDEELLKQAEALSGDGAIDLTGAEALADSAPGPQAAQHGAAAGHQGPRQRRALRAV